MPLAVGQIDVGGGPLRQPVNFAVPDQTHHHRPRAIHLDPAPHQVAALEVALRESLIDDRHRRGIAVVPFREVPPLEQRNPQNLEEARRDRGARYAHLLARTGNVSIHLNVRPRPAPQGQRKRVGEAHGAHAGQRLEPVTQAVTELRPLLRVLAERIEMVLRE